MGPEFFQTPMGKKYYQTDLPRQIKAMERLADAIEKHSEPQEYIMLITYSFDSDYISIPCKSEEEAKDLLEKYLKEEILTIWNESKYEPIVRRHSDTEVELVYEEAEHLVGSYTDIASYRVIRTNNVPKAKITSAWYSDPRVVETNHGTMPLIDYLEIVSSQHGFDSYKELRKNGLHIKVRPIIEGNK